jgi:hypothetical protein
MIMSTDDDLITLLRRGFTQATGDLDSEPDLIRVVRRRYARARRRRLAIGVGVPAAALEVGSGLALAGQDIPNHNAAAVAPATSVPAPRTGPVTPPRMKPASYKVVALKHHSAPPSCPANATAPVGKPANPAGAWFWTNKRTCVFVGVGWADTKPASAAPVHINGYPGLYRTLKNGIRAIYAPVAPGTDDVHPRGGWVVLTVSAKAPQEKVVRLIIIPAN